MLISPSLIYTLKVLLVKLNRFDQQNNLIFSFFIKILKFDYFLFERNFSFLKIISSAPAAIIILAICNYKNILVFGRTFFSKVKKNYRNFEWFSFYFLSYYRNYFEISFSLI